MERSHFTRGNTEAPGNWGSVQGPPELPPSHPQHELPLRKRGSRACGGVPPAKCQMSLNSCVNYDDVSDDGQLH